MDDRKPRILFSDHHRAEDPILIVNKKENTYDMIKTLNPKTIESFSVEKGSNADGVKTKDRMIITTKSRRSVDIISLSDLLKKYKIPESDRMILSIDGEIVNANANKMQFDESNLMQIYVINLDKVDENCDLVYLKILTRTSENVKKANTIYIR